jgi:cardiolipin synthase
MENYQKHFESALGTSYRPGNHVTILQNGNEIFPAMLEAIRDAKLSIELVTYVYWHSQVAIEFANALCERAKAGITVRLLVDAVGGAIMSTRMVGQLEQAGVRIAWFRPFNARQWHRFNHRTHRKILIVDNFLAFTGGVGIADEWDGNASDSKHWRETHCKIEGPACIDLAKGFWENWTEATRERPPHISSPAAVGTTSILTTPSSVGHRPTAMERLYVAAIEGAKFRLWITTAYFVPTSEFVQALIEAAERGVDVRILTNGYRSNHKLTLHAGRATYDQLITHDVKIYEYQRTVLHAKLITVDKLWVTFGSANFDNRSLVLNDELNISLVDPEIVGPLDYQFLLDLKDSRHIRTVYWQRRGMRQRIMEAGSRAFSRQL